MPLYQCAMWETKIQQKKFSDVKVTKIQTKKDQGLLHRMICTPWPSQPFFVPLLGEPVKDGHCDQGDRRLGDFSAQPRTAGLETQAADRCHWWSTAHRPGAAAELVINLSESLLKSLLSLMVDKTTICKVWHEIQSQNAPSPSSPLRSAQPYSLETQYEL